MSNNVEHNCDVLVIGSGAAGLSLALCLASKAKVIVLSKSGLSAGSTNYAQGGIAGVFNTADDNDSVEEHIEDTKIAGGGLCDPEAVEFTLRNAHDSIAWLIEQGVPFDQKEEAVSDEQSPYHLHREGGHSHRRIFHAADHTGHTIQETLNNRVLEHPNITLLDHHNAIDLITTRKLELAGNRVVGAYVFNTETSKVETVKAKFVALCTGGASKVYQYTCNPEVSSGDGIAIAWRAGCRVANMEFNQFHPTTLYNQKDRNFLLTEALRGEGALLKRPNGTRFMPDYDERAELAPRDIVARAIDHEMKKLGVECMYLDISHKTPDFIRKHFPTIYERCLKAGIDMIKEPIPIVPAAHFTCGGVMVDRRGRTDIECLYAVGEVSYTGLHGANRLASNSLLECVVYGQAAAKDILGRLPLAIDPPAIPAWDESQVTDADEEVIIQHNWHELRLTMWDYVGIVRTDKRLERAMHRIKLLKDEVNEFYSNFRVSSNLLELRNLLQVAELIVRCAMKRKDSVGLHYNVDHPNKPEVYKPTILSPYTNE
ncbi:MAG: L-aspartate oxidase [Ruminobacter sp.]|uniref:L-aspartate oxidase n=1 Tax=Ruminobacter amylophilus TaxID=867 RepID=A0A662ZEW8_9GAMM|nr:MULTISPECIES: L-aspartate oxidase [Ruminobacter]MBQ3775845.1 L-aspartate oxidase [Ruminobacter sp.]SFP10286.1 L-aspartate oxidase [Ruminobacter amylophilus]